MNISCENWFHCIRSLLGREQVPRLVQEVAARCSCTPRGVFRWRFKNWQSNVPSLPSFERRTLRACRLNPRTRGTRNEPMVNAEFGVSKRQSALRKCNQNPRPVVVDGAAVVILVPAGRMTVLALGRRAGDS